MPTNQFADFQSALNPGDLFISYWLGDRLMVIVGDHQNILFVESFPSQNILPLISNFEQQVSQPEIYEHYITEQYRPTVNLSSSLPGKTINSILQEIGRNKTFKGISDLILTLKYKRLILLPDGLLHSLPLHLIHCQSAGCNFEELFTQGCVYATSATSYIYAVSRHRNDPPKQAVIAVGNAEDRALMNEAESITHILPFPTQIVTKMEELEKLAPHTDFLYIATHGNIQEAPVGLTKSSGWTLQFDVSSITPEDFYSERFRLERGAVVVLSACSVGHLQAGIAHELEGMIQSFFYAGASTVLAARWPILYETALSVFGGTIQRVYQGNKTFGVAMNEAILRAKTRPEVNKYIAGPASETFFWGPFAIFGYG